MVLTVPLGQLSVRGRRFRAHQLVLFLKKEGRVISADVPPAAVSPVLTPRGLWGWQ